jgi:polysaccharide export outer membrane protein
MLRKVGNMLVAGNTNQLLLGRTPGIISNLSHGVWNIIIGCFLKRGRRIDMTKSCIFTLRKRDGIASSFTITLLLFLLSVCATFGSESPSPQEANPAVSNASNQEIRGNDFILGAGDKLEITVYRHEDLTKDVQIDLSGRIAFPLVGEIQAGGLTAFQLRNSLQTALGKYIVNPEVFVTISTVQSQSAVVLGEVKSPGLFSLDPPRTCLQIIASAGGFTKNAKQETVLLIRGGLKEPETIPLNFKKMLRAQDLTQDIALRNGDIIYVPATRIENVALFMDHLQRILATFYQSLFSGLMVTK